MTGHVPQTTQNALTGLAGVAGLYGFQRSLDDELGVLIGRYGVAAVREASRRLTKGKRGRRPARDWPELRDDLHLDAVDWLDGRDPLKLRSNNSIATAFAKRHPGASVVSTHRRIMKKLAARRMELLVVRAWMLSEAERPFTDYFRAAEGVNIHAPEWIGVVTASTDRLRGALERYRAEIGEPDPAMTIEQIDSRMTETINALIAAGSPRRTGLFGLSTALNVR